MQIVVMLVFLGIWLLVLWFGSIALEATGMERRKARFQALSALTGTGFTTGEAEAVVNHPRRRSVATWLIFLGNAGIIAFLILVILYVRSGILHPSPVVIAIAVVILLLIVLSIRFGIVDRLSNAVLGAAKRGRTAARQRTQELLYQRGGYGLVRVRLGEEAAGGIPLHDTGVLGHDVTVLAVERGDEAWPLPSSDHAVEAGDHLLCYGQLDDIAGGKR